VRCLLNESTRRFHYVNSTEVVKADPSRLYSIVASVGLPRDIVAEILKQYIVPVDATVFIAADGIEGGEMLDRGTIAACLLAYLPHHSLFDCFSNLNDPSGNTPLPLARLAAPQNE